MCLPTCACLPACLLLGSQARLVWWLQVAHIAVAGQAARPTWEKEIPALSLSHVWKSIPSPPRPYLLGSECLTDTKTARRREGSRERKRAACSVAAGDCTYVGRIGRRQEISTQAAAVAKGGEKIGESSLHHKERRKSRSF